MNERRSGIDLLKSVCLSQTLSHFYDVSYIRQASWSVPAAIAGRCQNLEKLSFSRTDRPKSDDRVGVVQNAIVH
ncbi:hypothetical protein IQ235_17245, partial [Oscillatoriales cyanobacterium LEGE 11467]